MVEHRYTGKFVFLTIITFGVYFLYWLYTTTRDMNIICQDGRNTNPILVVVLSVVTLGLYNIFWIYSQGERLRKVGAERGMEIAERGAYYARYYVLDLLIIASLGFFMFYAFHLFIGNFNRLADNYCRTILRGNGNT